MSNPIVTVPNEYAEVDQGNGSYGYHLQPKADKWVWKTEVTERSKPHITRRSFAEKADLIERCNNRKIDRKKAAYDRRKKAVMNRRRKGK